MGKRKSLIIIAICFLILCSCAEEKQRNKGFYEDVTQIEITSENWEDYFIYDKDVKMNLDEAGNVETVQYFQCMKLKNEYGDRLLKNKESYVFFSYRQKIEKKIYQILDSRTGEWEFAGDFIHIGQKGQNDARSSEWSTRYEMQEYCLIEEFDTFLTGESLVMEVPGELKMEAVKGKLYLKK